MNLAIENAAPDVLLADHEGRQIQLASLWRAKALVLLFARHFG